MESSWTI